MSKKKLQYIDYECEVGERVYWENLIGKKFEGVIIKWENNLATVELDDGTMKIIEC